MIVFTLVPHPMCIYESILQATFNSQHFFHVSTISILPDGGGRYQCVYICMRVCGEGKGVHVFFATPLPLYTMSQ